MSSEIIAVLAGVAIVGIVSMLSRYLSKNGVPNNLVWVKWIVAAICAGFMIVIEVELLHGINPKIEMAINAGVFLGVILAIPTAKKESGK